MPICRPLADLIIEVIRVFHTGPTTGQVHAGAKLIPGLRGEDASGIAALRASIDAASQQGRSAGPATTSSRTACGAP